MDQNSNNQEAAINHRSVSTVDQYSTDEIASAAEISNGILKRPVESRYEYEAELGRGGMGVVNLVVDHDLGRMSAMKYIPQQYKDPDQRMLAFVTEARITAQLEHPNIVPIHEIGIVEETGTPFYTMKKVEGECLIDVIKQLRAGNEEYIQRFPALRMLDIFRKVCYAVAYAHSRNVIHRDLKPANVMIGQFGEVLLMDWGLAKYINEPESTVSGEEGEAAQTQSRDDRQKAINELKVDLTEDGIIKGSLAYISPEQAFGEIDEIDEQTDIFLLGATLYEMLTYSPPYGGQSPIEVVTMAERCEYEPPSKRNPNARIPLALERITMKAMAPLKSRRFGTVEQLINEIDAYLEGRRVCDRRVFEAGESFIAGGDLGNETYVITSGSVDVSAQVNGRPLHIATLGPGEIVGELASFTQRTRSATITAMETTETLVITNELLMQELEKLPPWMERIVVSMAERLRDLGRRIHPHLRGASTFPIVNQVYNIFLALDETPGSETAISLSVESMADEIFLNLGIPKERSQPLLDVLVAWNLCSVEEGEFDIVDMDTYAEFIDYCRWKLEVLTGVKQVVSVSLSDERASYFRTVLRQLQDADIDAVQSSAESVLAEEEPEPAMAE
jgi:serine/threonine-protein kinase